MRAAALLLALLCAAGAARAADEPLRAGVFEPPREAPAFSLEGSDGAELTLARFRGKVIVLAFGFTSCPDVCPVTLATLAKTRKELGDAGRDFQVVYVTVDPEHDDVKQMHTYLATFDPSFVGGTGSESQLEAVRNAYGILAQKKMEGTKATYGHSSFTYLIDRQGRLRALMPFGHPSDDYVHDLRILLQQP